MERILSIQRTITGIGAGSIEIPTPFRQGEMLPHAFPHIGPNGAAHKGNMRVEEITDFVGRKAVAVCTQHGCKVRVEVYGSFPRD